MNVKNLFKNLLTKAEQDSTTKASLAEQNAKDYAISLRYLDYANAIHPLSNSQQSDWTYTAPNDGLLMLNFLATNRNYISTTVNGNRYAHMTPMWTSNINGVSAFQTFLKKGDVFVISGLSATCSLMTNTAFVPFVVGG